jgi:hypothetical protein
MGDISLQYSALRFLFRALRVAGTVTAVAAVLLGARFLQQRLTDSSPILVHAVAVQSALPAHLEPTNELQDCLSPNR